MARSGAPAAGVEGKGKKGYSGDIPNSHGLDISAPDPVRSRDDEDERGWRQPCDLRARDAGPLSLPHSGGEITQTAAGCRWNEMRAPVYSPSSNTEAQIWVVAAAVASAAYRDA
jgi:hypothetical protein